MSESDSAKPIPKYVSLQLCMEIQQENRGKWLNLAGLQCSGCLKFSKGETTKMCVSSRPDNRGCNLVNERYEEWRKNGSEGPR